VRMAIAQKRLTATRVGRSYRINREDIEQYQATRAA
jgi:excisionase family DNA binding protein